MTLPGYVTEYEERKGESQLASAAGRMAIITPCAFYHEGKSSPSVSASLRALPSLPLLSSPLSPFVGQSFNANEETIKSSTL